MASGESNPGIPTVEDWLVTAHDLEARQSETTTDTALAHELGCKTVWITREPENGRWSYHIPTFHQLPDSIGA